MPRALIALLFLSVVSVGGGCGAAAPELARPPSFQRGVALGLFATASDDPVAEYESLLDEIHALGATDVSLVVTWIQDDVRASAVQSDLRYTASDETLAHLIRYAHRLGMRTLLFPILRLVHRSAEEWRGTIRPGDPARWFASYGARLSQLAALAEREHADALSVGSELASLEDRAADWQRLIAEARARYRGRLLYSANWDHYGRVTFWPALDAIGVSAYWELTRPGHEPTVEEALASWRPIRERLVAFGRAQGKPIVLTEVGYPSVRGAGAFPWNDFLTGEEGVLDEEAQRRLYQAFASAWSDEPQLRGVYFWYWVSEGGLGDRGYSPRGKAASFVVSGWYRSRDRLPPPR